MGRMMLVVGAMTCAGLWACATSGGATKTETPPAAEAPKAEAAKPAEAKPAEVPAATTAAADTTTKTEPAKTEPAKTEPAKTEPAKTEPAKTEPAKTEPAKTEPAKTEPAKTNPAKTEPAKTEPAKTEPAKTAPAKGGGKYTLVAIAAPDAATERSWKGKCGSCHGKDGKAQTEKGKKMKIADFTQAAWQTAHSDAEIRNAIVKGVKEEEDGVKKEMDGFGEDLKPEQIDALLKYVRWLGAPK
jgi:mono/diheme cytochrome c family protein